jgi:hypothetical protein
VLGPTISRKSWTTSIPEVALIVLRTLHVGVGDADAVTVRPVDAGVLALPEAGDLPFDLDPALPHRAEDDPVPAPAQLPDEVHQQVLDPAIAPRRDGQPRAGVDEDVRLIPLHAVRAQAS